MYTLTQRGPAVVTQSVVTPPTSQRTTTIESGVVLLSAGASHLDIPELVEEQRRFARSGIPRSLCFRKEQLSRLRRVLKANEPLLFDAIFKDVRKSAFEAYLTELGLVYREIDEAISSMPKWSKPRRMIGSAANIPSIGQITPEPLGSCLIIGAWNYPYQLTLAPLVAALAAGNTAIVKPSELPANTSAALAAVINANFEPGYLRVVEGGVSETTELISHRFDKVFFTGSTKVGRIVARAAAEHLTPVTLELGGKSPCIVTADADIGLAAKRIAWGKLLNAGQTCIAPDYLLVESSVHDELVEALKQQFPLVAGVDPRNSDSFIRIINKTNAERLARLIDHRKVVHGGEIDLDACYVAPTLMTDIGWSDAVMQEEIFGPILPVMMFDDLDLVIRDLKSRPKPLSLYMFTRDRRAEEKVLAELSFGGGCINDVVMHITDTRLPFGGVGDSGMGNYHAEAGFRTFSHYKSVLKKGNWFEPSVKYAPHMPWKLRLLRRLFG